MTLPTRAAAQAPKSAQRTRPRAKSAAKSGRRTRNPGAAGPQYSLELINVRPATAADEAEVAAGPVHDVRTDSVIDAERELTPTDAQTKLLDAAARSLHYLLTEYSSGDAPQLFLQNLLPYSAAYRLRIRRLHLALFHEDVFDLLCTKMRDEDLYPHEYLVALALLLGQDREARHVLLAELLIPDARQQDVLELIEQLPLGMRHELQGRYDVTYDGIGFTNSDVKEPLREHLNKQLARWAAQKSYAMLDHELSPAEHIYFYLAPSGGDTAAALALLHSVWSQGYESFDTLVTDWQDYVNNRSQWLGTEPSFTAQQLMPFLHDHLSADQLGLATQIYVSYARHGQLAGEIDKLREAGVPIAAAQRELALRQLDRRNQQNVLAAAATLDDGQLKWGQEAPRAAGYQRELNERAETLRNEVEGQGLTNPQKLTTLLREQGVGVRREATMAILQFGLGGEEQRRALAAFVRTPTVADRIYFLLQETSGNTAHQQILDLLTQAWARSELGAVIADAQQTLMWQESAVVRPAYNLLLVLPQAGPLASKLQALFWKNTRVKQGALRLKREAEGGTTPDAENTYRFLMLLDADLQRSVLAEYFEFFGDLRDQFEPSEARVRIQQLLAGPISDPAEGLERLQAIDAAGQLALGSRLSNALAGMVDSEALALKSEALARYGRVLELVQKDPTRLHNLMRSYGARDSQQLFQMLADDVQRRIARVKQLRATTAQFVDTLLSIAGRSLIVAALGPAGLASLVSALGGFASGMVAHEYLMGPDYELVSRANIATLVTEVVTYGFDALEIEKLIEKSFSPKTMKAFFNLSSDENADRFAAFFKEVGKTVSVNSIEMCAERGIVDANIPTFGHSLGRLANIALIGGNKAAFGEVTKQVNIYTAYTERLKRNAMGVLLYGPPPKAAVARAIGIILAKTVTDPKYIDMNSQQIAQEVMSAAAWSLFYSLSVGASLSAAQSRAAKSGRELGEQDSQGLDKELLKSKIFSPYYADYQTYAKARGIRALSPSELLRTQLEGTHHDGGFVADKQPSKGTQSKFLDATLGSLRREKTRLVE